MALFYFFYRVYSGVRYRVGRRFTRAGLAVAGGAAISAAMGPDVEHNVAYQAFSILSAMLLVAFVWTLFFRGRFSAERVLPKFGTVGQPFSYVVRVRNLTGKRQAGLIVLEDLEDSRPGYREWKAIQAHENRGSFRLIRGQRRRSHRCAWVGEARVSSMEAVPGKRGELRNGGAGGSALAEGAARMELLPLRRGLLRFRGVTMARPDPLGLLRAFVRVKAPQSVLILPHRYGLPPVALPGATKYQEGGVAMASHIGQSEDFVSLRDYRHGDPLRHIHWRSWARVGKPITKEFEDEFFVRHALVLDTFCGRPMSEAFEEAVSVAASFACTIETQESLLDLLFVGPESYCFTAGRGLAHADQMLAVLAGVQRCTEKGFDALESLVMNHVQVVSGCICVLLDWDEPRREFVRKLRAISIPVLVLVVRERGMPLDLEPGPMRDSPGEFIVMEVGKVEEGLGRVRRS